MEHYSLSQVRAPSGGAIPHDPTDIDATIRLSESPLGQLIRCHRGLGQMSKISKASRSSDKGAELPAGVALDAARPLVFVLDDELRIREAIAGLLASAGLRVEAFATGAEFLRASSTASPACVVLDLQLPDISGSGSSARTH